MENTCQPSPVVFTHQNAGFSEIGVNVPLAYFVQKQGLCVESRVCVTCIVRTLGVRILAPIGVALSVSPGLRNHCVVSPLG